MQKNQRHMQKRTEDAGTQAAGMQTKQRRCQGPPEMKQISWHSQHSHINSQHGAHVNGNNLNVPPSGFFPVVKRGLKYNGDSPRSGVSCLSAG
jgi:hypothetical protein